MVFSRIFSQLPSLCPLCSGPARAGLICEPCRHDLYTSVRQVKSRCQYCHTALFSQPTTETNAASTEQEADIADDLMSAEDLTGSDNLMSSNDLTCPDCHEHRLILHTIYCGFDYELPIDSLILRFKNARQLHLSHTLADLVYQRFEQDRLFNPKLSPSANPRFNPKAINKLNEPASSGQATAPLWIPIPSSRSAIKRRGYNPAAEFAKSLAKYYHAPLELNILHRQDSQLQQKSLSRQDRLIASSQKYYCAYRLDHPHVILVDDIMTSGSTLDSAARALLAAGVQRVDALVIARSLHHY